MLLPIFKGNCSTEVNRIVQLLFNVRHDLICKGGPTCDPKLFIYVGHAQKYSLHSINTMDQYALKRTPEGDKFMGYPVSVVNKEDHLQIVEQ